MKKEKVEIKEVSMDSMERLASIMNNTPLAVDMGDKKFLITALKPGTQWLIAEISCGIQRAEKGNMNDIIKQFSVNIPSVASVLTLAILNDKDRIFSDFEKREYSEEYKAVYETILWETNQECWLNLLVEVIQMLDFETFFKNTNAIATIREMALGRKMKKDEQK